MSEQDAEWRTRVEPVLRAFVEQHEAVKSHSDLVVQIVTARKTGQDGEFKPALHAAFARVCDTKRAVYAALEAANVRSVADI